jgi:tetratricopeptide (TPR) repeat protein
LGDAIERAAEAQVAATERAAEQITMAVVESGRLQTEAIVAMHRQMTQQLGEISGLLRHPDAVRAVEHFIVGVNLLNNANVRRAHEQFRKAIGIYAGHFPTLFAYGFCCRVLNDLAAAQDALETALSQAGTDPEQSARQRSLAALYLGRIAFDRRQYDQARRWFHQAYCQNASLWNALVEGAASLLLDPKRTNRRADALAVKGDFNSNGANAYLLWYTLALILAPLAPEVAVDAFRHGSHGDYRVRDKDRVGLIALLWQLNPRTAGTLLGLVESDLRWL